MLTSIPPIGPPVNADTVPEDWRHRGACRDEDPELFFTLGNGGPPSRAMLAQIAEAKAVCRRCPVAASCLAWALETGVDHGVWGGMSDTERRALKRRQAGEMS